MRNTICMRNGYNRVQRKRARMVIKRDLFKFSAWKGNALGNIWIKAVRRRYYLAKYRA